MKRRDNSPQKTKDTPPEANELPSRWEHIMATIKSELTSKNYIAAHSQLLKLNPKLPSRKIQVLSILAYTSRHLNRRSEALNYLKQAEQVDDTTPDDLKFISSEYVALKDYHKAIGTIKKIEPMDGETFHLLGFSHFKLGEVGKALPIYKKLFFHLQANPTIARELSLVAAEFRDFDVAISAYTRYIQLIAPSAADHLKFADLLLMEKKVKESQSQLKKSVAMGGKDPYIHLLKAKIDRLNGKYSDSIKNATQASLYHPKGGTAWQIIAELISPEEINEELVTRLQKAIASHTESTIDTEISHFALSDIYIKQGKYVESYKQMITANQVKHKILSSTNNLYNSRKIESNIEKTITIFNSPLVKPATSSNQHRPIFIVGMPRSGTTLINKIIENSGNARSLGESEEIPRIMSQLQLEFGGEALNNLHRLTEGKWDQLAESYLQAEKIRKEDTIDKMPINSQNIGLILSLFPHARIIRVIRNPFDVCMSIFSKPFPEGHTYACQAEDIAHYYYQSIKIMQFWPKAFPQRIFNLNFDDFLKSPSTIGENLFHYLGYDWKENFLSSPEKSNNFTFSELQVRKSINRDGAQKWSHFSKIAVDLKEALDYESKGISGTWEAFTKG